MRIVNFRTDRIIRSCVVSFFVYGNFLFSLFFTALLVWNLTVHKTVKHQLTEQSKSLRSATSGLRVVAQVP